MLLFMESLKTYLILLIFFGIIELFLLRHYKKHQIKTGKGFAVGWQLLALLLVMILQITGASGINNIGQYDTLIRLDEINLIPFAGDPSGMIANMIMFIPLGMAFPLLWVKDCNWTRTVAIGFLFSLFIELSQLLNFRATDIDDLIMNTLGALIGYIVYSLLLRKCTLFQVQNRDADTWLTRNGAFGSVLIVVLFHFFIGSPLLSFTWSQLYQY